MKHTRARARAQEQCLFASPTYKLLQHPARDTASATADTRFCLTETHRKSFLVPRLEKAERFSAGASRLLLTFFTRLTVPVAGRERRGGGLPQPVRTSTVIPTVTCAHEDTRRPIVTGSLMRVILATGTSSLFDDASSHPLSLSSTLVPSYRRRLLVAR